MLLLAGLLRVIIFRNLAGDGKGLERLRETREGRKSLCNPKQNRLRCKVKEFGTVTFWWHMVT